MMELKRWRARRGIPLVLEPKHFPVDETAGARLVIAAARQGLDALSLATEIGRAVRVNDQNIANPEVLVQAAKRAGLDAAAIRRRTIRRRTRCCMGGQYHGSGLTRRIRRAELHSAIGRGLLGPGPARFPRRSTGVQSLERAKGRNAHDGPPPMPLFTLDELEAAAASCMRSCHRHRNMRGLYSPRGRARRYGSSTRTILRPAPSRCAEASSTWTR